MITCCSLVCCFCVVRQWWLLRICSSILGTLLFLCFRQWHGWWKVMLWKTFKEPGTWPLPYLKKHVGFKKARLFGKLFYLRTEFMPTSRCSLQILHSHTARGRLLHCVPHLVHILYGIWEDIWISQVDSSSCYPNCVMSSREWWLTHFFAVLTHYWADPRWAKLLSTQQTAGHAISTYCFLHVVKAVYQSPAEAQGQGNACRKMSE